MKKIKLYLLTMMVIFLSSTILLAQLTVSSHGGKAPVLPDSRAVLYQQTNSSGGTMASQDFETAYDAYDCQGADDFYVPADYTWTIETIVAYGTKSITSAGIDVVNVLIYADAAGFPAATAVHSFMGLTCTDASGVLYIPIPGGLALGPGHYWLSVQDAAPYATFGQWYWTRTTSIFNSGSCWRNPGNGFGLGAITWTNMTALGYPNSDFCFRLEGNSFSLLCVTGGGHYCDGDPGVDVGIDGSVVGISYTLYIDGMPTTQVVPGTGSPIYFGPQTIAGTYTVMASSPPDPACFVQVTIDYPPGQPGPITGPGSVCKGDSGIQYCVAQIAGVTSYNWTLPANAVITDGAGTECVTIDFLTANSGPIRVQAENTCGSGQPRVLPVIVRPRPNTPSISIWQYDYLKSSQAFNYQWYWAPGPTDAGQEIIGEVYQIYEPGIPGNNYYYVIVANKFGCFSFESNRIQFLKSAEAVQPADKILNETDFRIFPNPNDGQFTVLTKGTTGENYSISVYNSFGMKIYELNDEFINDEMVEKTIELKFKNSGIYILVFKDSQSQVVKKILISR